jgi:hypothetical protein
LITADHRFQIFRIAAMSSGRHSLRIVNAKKKAVKISARPAPAEARAFRAIRLQPSTSDYETFVVTTALAMGRTVTPASTPKPNTRLLSLVNLGA